MNSYNNAYNNSRRDAKARDLEVYESQRIDLVNAIKREYGISDFSTLSESERQAARKLITEMWSPKTGLNKAGVDFINEGKRALSDKSTPEQVKHEFNRRALALLNNKFASSPLFNASDAHNLGEIMEDIKKSTKGSNVKPDFKMWFYEVMCAYVNSHKGDIFKKQ
jgi:hypothetical protein